MQSAVKIAYWTNNKKQLPCKVVAFLLQPYHTNVTIFRTTCAIIKPTKGACPLEF